MSAALPAIAVVAAVAACAFAALHVRRSVARLNRGIEQLHEEQDRDGAPADTWRSLAEIWRENQPPK